MTLLSEPVPAHHRKISTFICWLVILAFVGITMVLQAKSARLAVATEAIKDGPNLGLEITGRLAVGQSQLFNATLNTATTNVQLRNQMQDSVLKLASSPMDKVKAVVVIRELKDSQAAITQLNSIEPGLYGHPLALADAQILRSIYRGDVVRISPAQADLLIKHLGWFGKLALTQGLSSSDAGRAAILDSAHHSFAIMMGLVTALVIAACLGFLLLIVMIVLFSLGKLRSLIEVGDNIASPVYLETFALWALIIFGSSTLVARWKTGRSPLLIELLFAALTAAIALWPILRGVSWHALRRSLGWHSGRGILSEMGAGILGYLAGLPVLAVGIGLTLLLAKLGHATPTHPIQQQFAGGLPLKKLLGLLIMISVAAPFLEETMFRGALYYHLRSRHSWWFSAAVVALLFAAIHPQGWAAIPALGSIALVLAALREWRGSLIASMTAHGINNGLLLLSVALLLK